MLPFFALAPLATGFMLMPQAPGKAARQPTSKPVKQSAKPSSQPARRVAPDRSRIEIAKWGEDAPGQAVMVNRRTGEAFKFKPIKHAPYGSAEKLSKRLRDKDIVIGLVVGKQAFAYPINMLGGPQREIINEEFAGQAFCVNW